MLICSIIISISPTGVNKEDIMGKSTEVYCWLHDRDYRRLFGPPKEGQLRKRFAGSIWYYRLSDQQVKTCKANGVHFERA